MHERRWRARAAVRRWRARAAVGSSSPPLFSVSVRQAATMQECGAASGAAAICMQCCLAKEHGRGQGFCTGLGLGVAEAMNFDGRSNKELQLNLVKVELAVSVNLRKKEHDDGM
ncbi:hypothetical protein NL676_034186 [Syzygium grande]|nr:hypothetical protein NL676_034186 [Syzygium grande]